MSAQRKLVIIGALAALLLVAAWVVATPHRGPEEVPPGAMVYRFDESSPETRKLMLSAVQGSADAATQLMGKYTKCHKMAWQTEEENAKCLESLRYWTDIALQNGSAAGAQLHSMELIGSRRCLDVYRGEFWYNRFKSAYRDHPIAMGATAEEIAESKKKCRW